MMKQRKGLMAHNWLEANIQFWAMIDPPAKRHNMAFRWWVDDGPL